MSLRIDSQLLTNLKQIIEVSQARGCWRALEMGDIENTQEQQVPETGDSGNTSNTENVVDGTGSKVLNI